MGEDILDPELGAIRRHGEAWTVHFAGIDVTILDAALTAASWSAVLALRDRFDRLMSEAIAAELLALEAAAHRSTTREQIFLVYKVVGATIEIDNGAVVLEVGFEPAWSADHHVTVFLRDWTCTGSALDS